MFCPKIDGCIVCKHTHTHTQTHTHTRVGMLSHIDFCNHKIMNSSVSIGELAALSLNLPNDYHSKSVLQKGQKPIKVGNVVEHQP